MTSATSSRLSVALCLLLAGRSLAATDLSWDPNGTAGTGGTGIWDTTHLFWNNGTALVAWSNAPVNNAIFSGSAGTVTLSAPITAQNLNFTPSGYVITGSTLTVAGTSPAITSANAATIQSVIAGAVGLVKSGAGTLTITNTSNSWRGGTTISQGTLVLGANGVLPSDTVTLGDTNTGANAIGLLASFGNYGATPIRNNIVVSSLAGGTVSIGSTDFRNTNTFSTNYSGTITLNRDVVLVGGNTDRTSFAGLITGTGNLTITCGKTTCGRVTIDNPGNNVVGNITIAPGATLQTFVLGALPDTSSMTVNGTLQFAPTSAGTDAIDGLNGSGVVKIYYYNVPVTLTVGTSNGSGNFSGLLQDNPGVLSLSKNGTGAQVLSGLNTYAGTTTLNGGVLSVARLANGGLASNIGDSSSVAGNLVFNGGTLQYTGSGASTDRLFTLGTGGGAIDASGAGVLNFRNPGTIALGSQTGARVLTLTGTNGGANTLSPVLGDNGGPTAVVKSGPGTWVLTGSNTYSGGTSFNQGVLNVAGDTALGAANGALIFNGGALQWGASFDLAAARPIALNAGGGTFDTQGFSTTVGSLIDGAGGLTKLGTGTLTLLGANAYAGVTTIGAGTLQVGNGGASGSIAGDVVNDSLLDIDRSGTVTFPGIISGTGAVRQMGDGITVLTGNNTYTGGTTISAGTLQLGDGGSSGDVAGDITDDATLAFHRSDTLTFGGLVSGTGGLIQQGTGTTILTGANTYSGPTTVQSGTLIVDGSVRSPVTVLAGGVLAGSGLVAGDVLNQGTVWPGLPVAGDTSYQSLTIRGNYSDPQGLVVFNTFLGNDISPSSRLVIDGGGTSGTSAVQVHITGNSGERTQRNGILLVHTINGGSTTIGAFELTTELRGGEFDYRLLRGSVDGSAPNDWFLRSEFVVLPPQGTPVVTQTSAPPVESLPDEPPAELHAGESLGLPLPRETPRMLPSQLSGEPPPDVSGGVTLLNALPVDPPPAVLPPGEYPIIGPEVATYSVVQPIARQMDLTTLGTFHERVGDTLTPAAGGTDNMGWAQSGWGRVFGQQIDNRYETFADSRASGQIFGLQTGLDLWRDSSAEGPHDAAGFYFAYGHSNADVDGLVTNDQATAYTLVHTGTATLNGYSLGAYWTHLGATGWYVDTVMQGTHFDGHAQTIYARLPVSGYGFDASLEVGYPIALAWGPNFELEPQAQFIWQHIDFGKANDGEGIVDLGATSGATGRLGVRGRWTVTEASGTVWQPYVRFNLWQNWGADAKTTYASVDQTPLYQATTLAELAVGLTATLTSHINLYGQLGYQHAINASESGQRKGVWGDVGMRLAW